MTNSSRSRESLSLRVDATIKQQYENRILEKFGVLQPYAGTELERELRVITGNGELSELVDKAQQLTRSIGETSTENKNLKANRSGDSEVIGYRIHSEVRSALKSEAQRASDVTYASELVESAMLAYARGDQTESKVAARLDRIEDFVDANTSDKDVVTRRTESIAEVFQDKKQFTLADFDTAVDEKARGINAGDYARKEYLPRVLEEIDYVTHPEDPEIFQPAEMVSPSEQDPRNKLPILRDEDEMVEIIVFDVLNRGLDAEGSALEYTPADAADALGKGMTRGKARQLFDRVALMSDRIEHIETKNHLKIDCERFNKISFPDIDFSLKDWMIDEFELVY